MMQLGPFLNYWFRWLKPNGNEYVTVGSSRTAMNISQLAKAQRQRICYNWLKRNGNEMLQLAKAERQ